MRSELPDLPKRDVDAVFIEPSGWIEMGEVREETSDVSLQVSTHLHMCVDKLLTLTGPRTISQRSIY